MVLICIFLLLMIGGLILAYIAGRTRLYSPLLSRGYEALSWVATITGGVGAWLSWYPFEYPPGQLLGLWIAVVIAAFSMDYLKNLGRPRLHPLTFDL